MKYIYYGKTILGDITMVEENGCITNVYFGKAILKGATEKETEILKEAYRQLKEYLTGKRKEFNLKLNPQGTEFRKKVWKVLEQIPYGKTKSYKEIAIAVGNEKASRAIGNANHNNPIPIFIPCHRVIGKDGKLVGYGGGLGIKRKLLDIENIIL